MENSIGPIANPKSITHHAFYSTCGPIGLCAALQLLFADLLKALSWPALSTELPSSNYTSMPRSSADQIDDISDESTLSPHQYPRSIDRGSGRGNGSERDNGLRSSIMLPSGT